MYLHVNLFCFCFYHEIPCEYLPLLFLIFLILSFIVRHGKVHLLYRAEDHDGNLAGTSRIGLAISDDGVNFPLSQRRPIPVLFPDNDEYTTMEWQGGLEDPRVVESPSGEYVMTYTS